MNYDYSIEVTAVKQKTILFMYLLPVWYMAMYCDIAYKIVWPYLLAVLWILFVRKLAVRSGGLKLIIAGFVFSLLSSLGCILVLQQANFSKWSAYFGPFFPLPLIFVYIIAEIIIKEIKKAK